MESVRATQISIELLSHLEEYRKNIVKEILQHINSSVPLLREACLHLINAGGKLLRPSLVVLACKAVGGDENLAIFSSVGAETAHVASLIHDDIIDEDDFRRNVETVHKKYGIPMAILAGDFLIIKSFQMLIRLVEEKKLPAEIAIKLLKLSCEGTLDITEGEALDVIYNNGQDITLQEYLRIIELKTARAFEIAMKGGAILGFGRDFEVEMLGKYGLNLGMAFQIQDDLLSSIGDQNEVGKSISDILKKRKTFMVAYVNTFGSSEYRNRLKEIMSKQNLSKEDIGEIKNIFIESGALVAAKEYIRDYTSKAIESIRPLKNSSAKEILIELANYLAERTK